MKTFESCDDAHGRCLVNEIIDDSLFCAEMHETTLRLAICVRSLRSQWTIELESLESGEVHTRFYDRQIRLCYFKSRTLFKKDITVQRGNRTKWSFLISRMNILIRVSTNYIAIYYVEFHGIFMSRWHID